VTRRRKTKDTASDRHGGRGAGPEERLAHLKQVVRDLLAEARRQGASAAEAGVSSDQGLAVTVRLGEVETVEHTRDNGLGVTVYLGRHKGSASTSDLSPQAIRETVRAACNIARFTSEDPYSGLADPDLMARDVPQLDLHHPWPIAAGEAVEHARACEDAARAYDARITNSEGATLETHQGVFVYGNSHDFLGGYPTSRHSLSCAVIGEDSAGGMQRDYWYTTARSAADLEAPEVVGRRAAERTVARLGARRLGTRQAPVLFRSEVAVGLLRSLVGAIRGPALYRRASFLLDALGKPVFPAFVRIHEDPLKPRGLGSSPFDDEGVATRPRDLVAGGTLRSYVLDSYAARRLGTQTTGNAGGVRNLTVEPGDLGLAGLLREMGNGLLVTELMGQGVNLVTGDYSRGAAGFWVEGGEIAFPVEEITIAGNLKDMFRQLVAVGSDIDCPGSFRTGSWLIEAMTIAGE
jgi:PmbA protein